MRWGELPGLFLAAQENFPRRFNVGAKKIPALPLHAPGLLFI
jgi:hypothetical protein